MKEIVKLNSMHNVKNTIIKCIFAEINNAVHITRKNIVRRNVFIKKMF